MQLLWYVEHGGGEHDRHDEGGEDPPVPSLHLPSLVPKGRVDCIEELHIDVEGEEHAGRDRNVAETITDRNMAGEKGVDWLKGVDEEHKVGEDH